MSLLTVSQELCVKCGICAEVCPNGIIGMTAEGPQMKYAPACIACGHCTAVCPHGALDHVKAPLDRQTKLVRYPVIDSETAAAFLRSRRSIRAYKKEKIAKEKILQLLDIARFAPSGCNSQGLSYIVIENSSRLKEITEATIKWLEKQLQDGAEWAKAFAGVADVYRKQNVDVILRGAPSLIVATAPRDFPFGHDNARFSLEYVELYATALGLGSCWAGFVEMAAGNFYQPLLAAMGIREDFTVAGAMMLGYPKYTYPRLADRNPLQVSWLE
ncbi:MAG: nitroreductase family protein [Veillonellales bacterium]